MQVTITFLQTEKNGRADPLPFSWNPDSLFSLLLIDCLFQFSSGGKLRDFPGSDLDSCAGLRIAPVPGLSLRHRESAETYQSHAITFPQSRSNAAHGGIYRGRSLRFADFASACDLVNQIGFIHSFSSQVSFIPSRHREDKRSWLSWET
jgi:hypothetical protein